ncbi:hypothetical protein WN944_015239 [Citrus x changshan-huyou]|uniref:SnoaL-like domain-containing protein n=1 Tax=Citrus x changshan-huyou TaxID=2935761 RepID=A0AAP0QMD1_9ROSI
MLMTSSISSSSLRTSPSSLLPCLNQTTFSYSNSTISNHFISTPTTRKQLAPLSKLRISSSENNRTAVDVASPPPTTSNADGDDGGGADVVRRFYDGINGRDLASVEELIADDCVYEDLIFPRPFVGRKATLDFFKKFSDSISSDLQFVIDDISAEDSSAVGVTWHLEWKGKPFPFSKGCSFYKLEVVNGKRQITYGRDIVEPAFKPGETALAAIGAVTWLLQQFPQLADRL